MSVVGFNFLTPCMTLAKLSKQLDGDAVAELWPLAVWALIHIVYGCAFGWAVCKLTSVPKAFRPSVITAVGFNNVISLPLLVADSLAVSEFFIEDKTATDRIVTYLFMYSIGWNIAMYLVGYPFLAGESTYKAMQLEVQELEKLEAAEAEAATVTLQAQSSLNALGYRGDSQSIAVATAATTADLRDEEKGRDQHHHQHHHHQQQQQQQQHQHLASVRSTDAVITSRTGVGADNEDESDSLSPLRRGDHRSRGGSSTGCNCAQLGAAWTRLGTYWLWIKRQYVKKVNVKVRFALGNIFGNPITIAIMISFVIGLTPALHHQFHSQGTVLRPVMQAIELLGQSAIPLGSIVMAGNAAQSLKRNFGIGGPAEDIIIEEEEEEEEEGAGRTEEGEEVEVAVEDVQVDRHGNTIVTVTDGKGRALLTLDKDDPSRFVRRTPLLSANPAPAYTTFASLSQGQPMDGLSPPTSLMSSSSSLGQSRLSLEAGSVTPTLGVSSASVMGAGTSGTSLVATPLTGLGTCLGAPKTVSSSSSFQVGTPSMIAATGVGVGGGGGAGGSDGGEVFVLRTPSGRPVAHRVRTVSYPRPPLLSAPSVAPSTSAAAAAASTSTSTSSVHVTPVVIGVTSSTPRFFSAQPLVLPEAMTSGSSAVTASAALSELSVTVPAGALPVPGQITRLRKGPQRTTRTRRSRIVMVPSMMMGGATVAQAESDDGENDDGDEDEEEEEGEEDVVGSGGESSDAVGVDRPIDDADPFSSPERVSYSQQVSPVPLNGLGNAQHASSNTEAASMVSGIRSGSSRSIGSRQGRVDLEQGGIELGVLSKPSTSEMNLSATASAAVGQEKTAKKKKKKRPMQTKLSSQSTGLFIFTRLVICPAAAFLLAILCDKTGLDIFFPKENKLFRVSLMLIALSPSAESVLVILTKSNMTKQAFAMSLIYLYMYLAAVITISFGVTLAIWYAFL